MSPLIFLREGGRGDLWLFRPSISLVREPSVRFWSVQGGGGEEEDGSFFSSLPLAGSDRDGLEGLLEIIFNFWIILSKCSEISFNPRE